MLPEGQGGAPPTEEEELILKVEANSVEMEMVGGFSSSEIGGDNSDVSSILEQVTTSATSSPASAASRKRKVDLQPEQNKRSKKKGDKGGDKKEDTEEDREEGESQPVYYPYNHWPKVKIERLEGAAALFEGVETKMEELVNQVKEDEARKDQLETAMNDLLEHLEEEKAKNHQMEIDMKTKLSAVEEELRKALEEKEKAVRELEIDMRTKLGAVEEELREAVREKEKAVMEKEEIQLKMNLRKQEAHETIKTNMNRLINLDNTLKNMLKTKVALLFLILKKRKES